MTHISLKDRIEQGIARGDSDARIAAKENVTLATVAEVHRYLEAVNGNAVVPEIEERRMRRRIRESDRQLQASISRHPAGSHR